MTAGKFELNKQLMLQLSLLTTEELAKNWWKEYLDYHKEDQGIKYMIGYFADEKHRNNLYKWLF